MGGRKAAAAVLVFSLMPWAFLPFAGAETFGALSVAAPEWQLLVPPTGMNYTHDLFQTPGDLNGDGFDDLVLWQTTPYGQTALTVANGSAGGIDLAHQWTWWYPVQAACVPEGCTRVSDPGNPAAVDSRPTQVDPDFDNRSELLYRESPLNQVCTSFSGGPPQCPSDSTNVAFAFGPKSVPADSTTVSARPLNEPPSFAYLIGRTRPEDTGAVLVEQFFDRAADGSAPAYTQFSLARLQNRTLLADRIEWSAPEPTPLSAAPRPPHFFAAPDFDRDGLADIVTMSPPAATGSVHSFGVLTIYNGSSSGPAIGAPATLHLDTPNIVIGDFDGDGHADIGEYRPAISSGVGTPTRPHIDLTIGYWDSRGLFFNTDTVTLYGPSIFASQPPVKIQAGDIDGDGRVDLVAVKYDTTSASSGHLLVDVFLGVPSCGHGVGGVCDATLSADPSFSTEIQLSGTDIYTGGEGVRVNAQGDFDGDGHRDITVGYFGGNAPERGRTSSSGFVAVLYASTVLRSVYKIWIDTDPGLAIYPAYRNYTVHIRDWHVSTRSSTLQVYLVDLESLYVDVEVANSTAFVGPTDQISVDGGVSLSWVAAAGGGEIWSVDVPLRFNWSLPTGRTFGLDALFKGGNAAEEISNPRAARYDSFVQVSGSLLSESEGHNVNDGGWARAGPALNFTNLTLVFASLPSAEVPPDSFNWQCWNGAGALWGTFAGGHLAATIASPTVTTREVSYLFNVSGAPSNHVRPTDEFIVNFDADPPQFGAHLPLESDWVTSSPTFVAVDIFDNESGVDPDRVEVSWENDGAPFVRWDRATALPGQTLGEVVAKALIKFPEGNLSNLIWRVWDKVGNGPAESPIFGVKVDTLDVTFLQYPPADAWQNDTHASANVEIRSGSSGIDPTSIQYRFSTAGLFGFGPWIPGCGQMCRDNLHPNDTSLVIFSFVSALEGDYNWIQWRASSYASGVARVSDPYQIRVDSLAPVITSVLPNASALFPAGAPVLTVSAHEGSPEGVPQRGLDTRPGGATYRVQGPGQSVFGPPHTFDSVAASPDLWTAEFQAHLDLERGNSTIEVAIKDLGGLTAFARTTVRINQIPTLEVDSTPPNFTVEVNGTITLTAVASDPDSGDLAYTWQATYPFLGCFRGSRLPVPPFSFSRNATVTLSPTAPECLRTNFTGDITLMVFAHDALDGVAFQRVVVHIGPQAPPPPPPPPAPQVVSSTGDASFALALLLVAVGIVGVILLLRRRRTPPDNV